MTEIREYDIEALGKGKNQRTAEKQLIIFGCVVAGIIVLALLSSSIKDAIWERMWTSGYGPYIATMYVEGTIAAGQTDTFGLPIGYQHNWTLEKIDELIADSNNRGLLVFVDSPGGGVYESDELLSEAEGLQEVPDGPSMR